MEESPISFDLLDFSDPGELTRIVESFCRVTGLAGGIVGMPPDESPLKSEADLRKFRLTEPEVINPSRFCTLVRACESGNSCCMQSDLKNAKEANLLGKGLHYHCHMGITDLIAPIRVCGRHVANVYLGQIRPKALDFTGVHNRYQHLVKQSGIVRHGATEAELRAAFEGLPSANETKLKNYAFFVETLANLISQRATRQAIVKMAVAASREVGVTLNLRTGLEAYLRYAIALLNGDTGSIFLLNPDNSNRLESYALRWGPTSPAKIEFDVTGEGIIAENARRNLELVRSRISTPSKATEPEPRFFVSRFTSRQDLDNHRAEQLSGNRDRRGLQSLLVVPIACGDELLGTLDVGSRRTDAFTADDEHVLRLFASVIGAYVWTVRQRQQLVRLFGKHDSVDLMHALVQEIPRDVHGIGCSIFVLNSIGELELAATTEFIGQVDYSKVTYRPREGFTGWVLQWGQPLRIRSGPQCRTAQLDRRWRDLGVQWEGKYAALEPKPLQSRSYYESRPFLAVPIKAADGRVAGVVRIPDRHGGDFSDEDEKIVQTYADFLGQFLKAPPARVLDSGKQKPRVFLGHGHHGDAAAILQHYLKCLGCWVQEYDEAATAGEFSFEIVSRIIRDSDVAVILYTGDGELTNGIRVGRQNVAHELGLAQGILGAKKTILLLESGVEKPTNVVGMQHVEFPRNNVKASFDRLSDYLTKAGIIASETSGVLGGTTRAVVSV